MFYIQLLHLQISQAQTYTNDLNLIFALLGSVCAKAAHKMLVELTPSFEKTRDCISKQVSNGQRLPFEKNCSCLRLEEEKNNSKS